jgi:hypothetical protein
VRGRGADQENRDERRSAQGPKAMAHKHPVAS